MKRVLLCVTVSLFSVLTFSSVAYASDESSSLEAERIDVVIDGVDKEAILAPHDEESIPPESEELPSNQKVENASTPEKEDEEGELVDEIEEHGQDGSTNDENTDELIDVSADPHPESERVEDGTYTIESELGTSLDVSGASIGDAANIQVCELNYSAAQRFRISGAGQVESGEWYYVIENVNSGKVVDCAWGGISSGTNVQQYAKNNTEAQQWFLRKETKLDGSEFYCIVNVASGLALDVAGANRGSGANVQLYAINGSAAQSWLLKKCVAVIEDGAYVIETLLPGGYVVDVASGSGDDGAPYQIFAANGSLAQSFALTYDEMTGYYAVTSYRSGKVMDVACGNPEQGALIQQYAANGSRAQKWQLLKNSDGSYSFLSSLGGKVLDVMGAQAQNGTRLQQFGFNGSAAQRFSLKLTTPDFSGGLVTMHNGANPYVVIDVTGGSRTNGTILQLCEQNSTFAQKFMIEKNEDGTFYIAALVSGLYLSALDDGRVTQCAQDEGLFQKWLIVPTRDGHFAIISSDEKLTLGVRGSIRQGSPLEALAHDAGLMFSWNMVVAPLLTEGYYTFASVVDESFFVDVAGASIDWRANVQLWQGNETNAQKYLVRSVGNNMYSIANAWSALFFDVEAGAGHAGANIQQYGWNGTAAQQWCITWDGKGGFVFKSALGQLAAGVCNGNIELVSYVVDSSNQRFFLTPTAVVSAGFSDRIAVLDVIAGSGLNVFKSMNGLSQQTIGELWDAIACYERDGVPVGFLMMDLTTGQGVSYNADRKFYSASTIKGPYVAALNMYWPWELRNWPGTMYDAINVSSNEAYATLRQVFGSTPLGMLVDETHAWDFNYNSWYVDYSARDLAKLWTGMYEYFMSDRANAEWCRNVYGSNIAITSRPTLSWKDCTIYAKSGWLNGGVTVHNEGCIVMDGDRPYLMVVMSEESCYNSWKMSNLMGVLDWAHREMVQ